MTVRIAVIVRLCVECITRRAHRVRRARPDALMQRRRRGRKHNTRVSYVSK